MQMSITVFVHLQSTPEEWPSQITRLNAPRNPTSKSQRVCVYLPGKGHRLQAKWRIGRTTKKTKLKMTVKIDPLFFFIHYFQEWMSHSYKVYNTIVTYLDIIASVLLSLWQLHCKFIFDEYQFWPQEVVARATRQILKIHKENSSRSLNS